MTVFIRDRSYGYLDFTYITIHHRQQNALVKMEESNYGKKTVPLIT